MPAKVPGISLFACELEKIPLTIVFGPSSIAINSQCPPIVHIL